jgi:hypothetical protein
MGLLIDISLKKKKDFDNLFIGVRRELNSFAILLICSKGRSAQKYCANIV